VMRGHFRCVISDSVAWYRCFNWPVIYNSCQRNHRDQSAAKINASVGSDSVYWNKWKQQNSQLRCFKMWQLCLIAKAVKCVIIMEIYLIII